MKTRHLFSLFLMMALAAAGCQGSASSTSGTVSPSNFEVVFAPLAVEESTISGIVFNDANASGVLDSGEAGISGVTVTLDGAWMETTDALGMYGFGTSVPGIHTVVETDPPGFVSTTPNTVAVAVTVMGIYRVDFGDMGAPAPTAFVDVKPGSMKNPLNLGSNGVTPAAVIGSASLDVRLIDPSTILLEGVPPVRWNYADAIGECAPGVDEDMDGVDDITCPDGSEDMLLKFDTQALAAAIGTAARGDLVTLHFTAALADGTLVADTETVTVVKGN